MDCCGDDCCGFWTTTPQSSYTQMDNVNLSSSHTDTTREYWWYWESDTTFEKYDEYVSKEIEKVFQSGHAKTVSLGHGQYEYEIDPTKMKQTSKNTGRERRIDRRQLQRTEPVFKLEYEVPQVKNNPGMLEDLLMLVRQSQVVAEKVAQRDDVILLKGDYIAVKEMKGKLEDIMTRWIRTSDLTYPENWEPQSCTTHYELKEVQQGTPEWTEVERQMSEPGFPQKILRIDRIQNKWLWEVYVQSRKRMADKNKGQLNEKYLFHGSKGTPPIKIYNSEQGFDSRMSFKGMWGEGAYFAVKAQYSHNYTHTTPEGHKQMFLVKVITGITHTCQPDYTLRAPPMRLTSSGSMFEDERYDSVNGTTGGSEIYVIYGNGKVYPAYLITYQ